MSNTFPGYQKERLPLVEQALSRVAATPLDGTSCATADLSRYLYAPLAHFTSGGGKRVRPVLCLLGAEAVGAAPERALSAGIAIELFQSAALIHDDIADESELRRGEPCLYVTEGTGVAINMGDLALTQVFEVVMEDTTLDAPTKLSLLRSLATMERHTLEGQALDLGWARDGRWDITSAGYTFMVTSKTAYYTAAYPLYLGAIAGGAREDVARELYAIGIEAGVAFQLQDDLLNLVGDADAQGKDFRSDITEGKRTLAVVHALENLGTAERDELVSLLTTGVTAPDDLARAVELIEAGGGIEHCRSLAEKGAEETKRLAAEAAEKGHITFEARDLLCSMADFFVERAA